MRLKYGIAVAGSHGKTTTTSMIAADSQPRPAWTPTVVVGGKAAAMGVPTPASGRAIFLSLSPDEVTDLFWLECRPFWRLSPTSTASIWTTTRTSGPLAPHLPNLSTKFRSMAPPYYASTTKTSRRFLPKVRRPDDHLRDATRKRTISPYDRQEGGDFQTRFRLRSRDAELGDFHLGIPGEHNVLNATAAIAVAMELRIDPDVIRQGLGQVQAVSRGGLRCVDSRRVSPSLTTMATTTTEIRATLAGRRNRAHRSTSTMLFQPPPIYPDHALTG